MKTATLGRTGIRVSRLCFGSLTIGPLQRGLSVDEGARVILAALEAGVDFIDSAELYGTYPHVAEAVRRHLSNGGRRPVVAAKSYAWDAKGAQASLDKARRELDGAGPDIFLLHEQESEHTLRGHREASEFLCRARDRGELRAFGISTHHVAAARAVATAGYVDVLHPIVNRAGLGVADGSGAEMLAAVEDAHRAGLGVYAMKVLGGGNLLGDYAGAMRFAMELPFVDSIAIGMASAAEVERNVEAFESGMPGEPADGPPKALRIEPWCTRCGKCVARCDQRALSQDADGTVRADRSKCVLCGYCATACGDFAIKVF
jgi:aryl-alcohol dehydrogenase-like predicted oxidoreductase